MHQKNLWILRSARFRQMRYTIFSGYFIIAIRSVSIGHGFTHTLTFHQTHFVCVKRERLHFMFIRHHQNIGWMSILCGVCRSSFIMPFECVCECDTLLEWSTWPWMWIHISIEFDVIFPKFHFRDWMTLVPTTQHPSLPSPPAFYRYRSITLTTYACIGSFERAEWRQQRQRRQCGHCWNGSHTYAGANSLLTSNNSKFLLIFFFRFRSGESFSTRFST